MNQCAEIVSTARGRGNATPNARHERVKSLSSSVFIGEPWPMNAAGIGSISLICSSCSKLTAFSRSHVRFFRRIMKFTRMTRLHSYASADPDCVKPRETDNDRYDVARVAARAMAADLRDVAHVDADRRQDASRTRSAAESLVAGGALPDGARTVDRRNAVRWTNRRNRVRFSRPCARDCL